MKCWKGRLHLATVAETVSDGKSTKPSRWMSLMKQNPDAAVIIAALVAVAGGSLYIGQLHHAVIHERELRERAVETERELRKKDVEAAKKDVEAAKNEVRMEMERRIADFLTKGDYRGVMEAIDAAKMHRDEVKVGG